MRGGKWSLVLCASMGPSNHSAPTDSKARVPHAGGGGLFLTKIARPLADRRISGAGEWPVARHTGDRISGAREGPRARHTGAHGRRAQERSGGTDTGCCGCPEVGLKGMIEGYSFPAVNPPNTCGHDRNYGIPLSGASLSFSVVSRASSSIDGLHLGSPAVSFADSGCFAAIPVR